MATTLESLVARFRRAVGDKTGVVVGKTSTPELEIRFQSVDHNNFITILKSLLEKKLPVDDGEIVHTINSIMDEKIVRAPRTSDATHRATRPQRLRQITFERGKRVSDKYLIKTAMMPPFRVTNPFALSYIVALSSESEDTSPFSSDEGAVIRVRARVGFEYRAESTADKKTRLRWRIDLTVVRQISGADADSSLKQITDTMFRSRIRMSPANMANVLRLDDSASRGLYRFEIEAELLDVESGEDSTPQGVKDIVRPSDVTLMANSILQLSNPSYLKDAAFQAEIYHVASFIVQASGYLERFKHELGLKRLLPPVVALTRVEYRSIYPPVGYYVTDKADGVRCVISVREGRALVLADFLYEYKASRELLEKSEKKARLTEATIVDCELVYDETKREDGETPPFTVYLFDVIAVGGENVSSDGIEKRITHLSAAASILGEFGIKAKVKTYVHISSSDQKTLETQFMSLISVKNRPYAIDGLILAEPGKSYLETTSYKYKESAHNTIDFLARRCPPSVLGKEPFVDKKGHKLHFLFNGISPDMFDSLGLQWCPGYAELFGAPDTRRPARTPANTGNYFPIQFSPSDVPLAYLYHHPDGSAFGTVDMKVIELKCRGDCAGAGGGASVVDWEMVRERSDRTKDLLAKRYYGNDFRVAELVWLNNVDPFPKDQLWLGPGLDYFARPKSGIYKAQTAFTSFVKSQRILTLRHSAWVVDLGFGKGQDLGRYMDADVGSLLAVDKDRAALAEAVRRKYTHADRGRRGKDHRSDETGVDERLQRRTMRSHNSKGTTLHVVVADLLSPFDQLVPVFRRAGLPVAGADAIVNNLAVHYMMGTMESMRNFVALCRECVRVEGYVIITAMFGQKVHALLTESKVQDGQSWDIYEEETLKFSIKRMYSGETLQSAGQKIGVLLPFSDGQYYEEYLVNTRVLTDEFVARGFRVVSLNPVQKHFEEFRMRNPPVYKMLTDNDKTYLSLYGEIILMRTK